MQIRFLVSLISLLLPKPRLIALRRSKSTFKRIPNW